MANILIVDDEQKICEVIKEYAEWKGYTVAEATNGMEAIELCRGSDFDVIVMDVMMPKLDGFTTVKEIKKIKDIPVIMLSARAEEYDKLFAFEVGVDDYMIKPFSPKELMARIAVILARKTPPGNPEGRLVYDGLVINLPSREVIVNGDKIALTPKEYDLLVYLVKNKNIALSREVLLADIWGYDFGDLRTIDTHIKNLRNNLGPYRNKIVTLRGIGYKFDATI